VLNASTERDLDEASAALVKQGAGGLVVVGEPFLDSQRDKIVALSARYAVPAIYTFREYVMVGGLMSYGASLTEAYRRAATYLGRILKGEKPAPSCAGTDQIRTHHQPQDYKGARPDSAACAAKPRRRGDRIRTFFPAVHESAFGTKRTSSLRSAMSAFEGGADIVWMRFTYTPLASRPIFPISALPDPYHGSGRTSVQKTDHPFR
jgi:hypothetical protein